MAGRDPWSWFDDDGKHVEPHELDDVDMVQRAEKIFGIELPAEQLSTVCTVGEFYDLIMRELGGSKRATRACLTQTAFYRLRRALAEMGASGPITPGTQFIDTISDLAKTRPDLVTPRTQREISNDLASRSRLKLPAREVARPLGVSWVLALFLFPLEILGVTGVGFVAFVLLGLISGIAVLI